MLPRQRDEFWVRQTSVILETSRVKIIFQIYVSDKNVILAKI